MSRYISIDLSRLPAPAAIETLDYEVILTARIGDFTTRWPEYDVGSLETDPIKIDQEVDSYREVLVRQTGNDKYKATRLAYAVGTDLDTLVGELGVLRAVLDVGDPNATPPLPVVMEADAELRYRGQLAWEAQSVAGPAGAYEFHGLTADPDVKDIAVWGPESEHCEPGEVLVTVLSRTGTGAAPNETLDAVAVTLDAYEVTYDGDVTPTVRSVRNRQGARPLTDKVMVESATIEEYEIALTIKVGQGADAEIAREAAQAAVEEYALDRHRIARKVFLNAIAAKAYVGDDTGPSAVEEVVITSPVADIDPGDRGAAWCTGIAVTVEIV